jgi:hypothetical protein
MQALGYLFLRHAGPPTGSFFLDVPVCRVPGRY